MAHDLWLDRRPEARLSTYSSSPVPSPAVRIQPPRRCRSGSACRTARRQTPGGSCARDGCPAFVFRYGRKRRRPLCARPHNGRRHGMPCTRSPAAGFLASRRGPPFRLLNSRRTRHAQNKRADVKVSGVHHQVVKAGVDPEHACRSSRSGPLLLSSVKRHEQHQMAHADTGFGLLVFPSEEESQIRLSSSEGNIEAAMGHASHRVRGRAA